MKTSTKFIVLILLGLSLIGCSDNDGSQSQIPWFIGKEFSQVDNIFIIRRHHHYGGYEWYDTIPLPANNFIQFSLLDLQPEEGMRDIEPCKFILYGGDFDLARVKGNPVSGIIACPCFITGAGIVETNGTLEKLKDSYLFQVSGNPTTYYYKIRIYENKILLYQLQEESTDNIDSEFPPEGLEAEEEMLCVKNIKFNEDFSVEASPFHIIWESKNSFDNLDESQLLQILLNTPFISAEQFGLNSKKTLISFGDIYRRVACITNMADNQQCKMFHLEESANVRVNAVLTFSAEAFSHSIFHKDTKSFDLLINARKLMNDIWVKPDDVAGNQYRQSPTPKNLSLMSNILLALTPQTAAGIPMKYEKTDKEATVYFADTETAVKVVKAIVSTILETDEDKLRLFEEVSKRIDDKDKMDEFRFFVNNINDYFNSTVTLEFGTNYTILNGNINDFSDNGVYQEIFNSIYGND